MYKCLPRAVFESEVGETWSLDLSITNPMLYN